MPSTGVFEGVQAVDRMMRAQGYTDGALTLAGTLNLALDVTKEELAANGDVTLATATGGIGGTVAIAGNVPSNWTVLARANSLVLKKINGTVVIVR